MKQHLLKSLSVASFVGLLAAVPVVLMIAVGPNWVQNIPRFIGIIPVLMCPPWWLFWGIMGHPDDVWFFVRICGAVLILNALLYAPLGVLHAYTVSCRPAIRRTLLGFAYPSLLVAGHLLFMSEPAIFNPLYSGLAP